MMRTLTSGEIVRSPYTGWTAKTLPQFITRQVHEIKDAVPGVIWNYCPTEDNPADLLTCGIDFKYLSSPNSLWWKGLAWVTVPDNWPKWQPQINVHMLAAAAIAEEFVPQPTIKEEIGLHHIIKITDYSSLNRLLAVTAYVYRCINNLCRLQSRQSGPLTAKELSSARMRWIQTCQEQSYPREIASIKSKPGQSEMKKPPLVRHSLLTILAFCVVVARFTTPPLSEAAKFPYLLPQNNHLTLLFTICMFFSHMQVWDPPWLLSDRPSGYLQDVSMSRNHYAVVQFARNMGQTLCYSRVSTTSQSQGAGCITIYYHWCRLYRSPLRNAMQWRRK